MQISLKWNIEITLYIEAVFPYHRWATMGSNWKSCRNAKTTIIRICICIQNLCTYYNTFNIFYTVCITILYYVLVELLLTCVRSKVVQEYYFYFFISYFPHLVVSESTYRNLCVLYTYIQYTYIYTYTYVYMYMYFSECVGRRPSLERARPDYPTANSYTSGSAQYDDLRFTSPGVTYVRTYTFSLFYHLPLSVRIVPSDYQSVHLYQIFPRLDINVLKVEIKWNSQVKFNLITWRITFFLQTNF